jgi:hypothetical protein
MAIAYGSHDAEIETLTPNTSLVAFARKFGFALIVLAAVGRKI